MTGAAAAAGEPGGPGAGDEGTKHRGTQRPGTPYTGTHYPGGYPSGAAFAEPGRVASRGGASLSIGEVLARLRDDFPDVTISKLRFLEAEGLVEPQRTASGYRKYSADDVERLAFVLAAQRDRYLPLRVIRDHLAAWDRGEAVTPPDYGPGQDGDLAGPAQPGDRDAAPRRDGDRLPRAELLERTGLSEDDLRELESAGLISARTPGWYDEDAAIVAAAAAGLARHGIGVRHLRAFRGTADRQVGLFAAVVAPLHRSASPGERARAAEVVEELIEMSAQMHAALVRAGMRAALGR